MSEWPLNQAGIKLNSGLTVEHGVKSVIKYYGASDLNEPGYFLVQGGKYLLFALPKFSITPTRNL
jgi:hypothetical protein